MYVNHDSCHQINLSIRGNAYLINETVTSEKRDIVYSKEAQSATSHGGQTEANCMQVIGESLTKQGISAEATKIILKSWRKGTSKQYQSYYKKWLDFCHGEQISTVRPSLAQLIEFLLTLFNNGLVIVALILLAQHFLRYSLQ